MGDTEELFGAEEWYTNLPTQEQAWVGKLVSLHDAGGFSIKMRSELYKLAIEEGRPRDHDHGNERVIYVKALKSRLDKYNGHRVKIIGKPYDVELEGSQLSEIWPARIQLL